MTARLIPQTEGSPVISLEKAITLIGRHPDCDGVLPDNQKISRRHCCIAQVENRLILRDLGSMNGVVVNGAPVSEVDLNDGDEITIGDEEFILEIKAKAAPAKSAPRPVKKIQGDEPTPEKPKPSPRKINSATSPSGSQRRPFPVDISQEFPVPIPEDDEPSEDEDVDLPSVRAPNGRRPIPNPPSYHIADDRDFEDARDFEEDDNGILKLDSGEIELCDPEKSDDDKSNPKKKKK